MQTKATLLARVPDGQGKFPFVSVRAKNGMPIPVPGATSYYLRHRVNGKRTTTALGSDLQEAYLAYANSILAQAQTRLGISTPEAVRVAAAAARTEIVPGIEKFLKELDQLGRSSKTISTYKATLRDFTDCIPTKQYVDEIDRTDVLTYISWIRKNCHRHVINGSLGGDRNSTIVNRLTYLRSFLFRFKVPMPICRNDWPKITRKNPDRYSTGPDGDVKKLLAVAFQDDKDLIQFLICTGFRRSEVAHACYRDINWNRGTINVHDKPEWAFKIKDHEQRPMDIPLPGWFVHQMKCRQGRNPKETLIFANTEGRPDRHLLDRIKDLAKMAGLSGNATLHKFRRTFASEMLKQFDVVTVQKMLGHADLQTTAKYLAMQDLESPEVRGKIDQMWSGCD